VPGLSASRRWRARRLAAALAAAVLALASAFPALAVPPVWTVRSANATLVLFGSVHLLPPGLDWRPPALDAALEGADEVWFELPIDAQTDELAAAVAQRRGSLPHGRRLSALLTPDEAGRLAAAAAALNCPLEALERMQPWMADLTLSVADDARSGANASDGVEEAIQRQAPAPVQRRAFETPEQQINFLAGALRADQIASLDWTMGEIVDDPGAYARVVDEWMSGDIAGLERDADHSLFSVSPGLYRRLVTDRNRRWAQVLAARLSRPGKIVVVVGVGHLIGVGGVPALLRERGFAVEGP